MSTGSPSYGDYGASNDHSQEPPRKKMRKGTKSCVECRRRKIKCTFEPGRTAICNECFARGSTCIDQEHGDAASVPQSSSSHDTTSLRDRVSNLEDMLREVLHRLPEKPDSARSREHIDTVDTQAAEVLKSLRSTKSRPSYEDDLLLPGGASEAAPALTLFDNAVIARKQVEPILSREQYNKAKALNSALLQLLPPLTDLELILESSQEWWTIWRTMFPEINSDARCTTIKESVSHSLRSDKPGEIGKIMLCIALGIHQLPPYFDWSRLSIKETPEDLMQRFVSTVDRLITSDEDIAATIEGIECMVLEAKWQINMGRPRKAWLLHHKAIAHAQLLGLHRIATHPPKKQDMTFVRQLNVWTHMVTGDRFLSLMMGLPYTVPESLAAPALDLARSRTSGMATENYILNMVSIVGKMVDRNQNPAAASFSDTIALDQQLEDVRSQTDPSWWTTERFPGTPTGKHFERLQAQFFHHHTRVLLHQPFMLRSSADKRFEYSHRTTLESAREMIKYYDALRGAEDIGPHACKIIDFQAFTAAMLLLLNLCGYSQAARGVATQQQPDLEQDQHDSALIDRTVSLLNNAATEAGGIVAAHCAQALATLAKIRTGCCEGYKDTDSIQISIPYFGRISIVAGKQFMPPPAGTYPDAGNPRPVPHQVNSQTGLPTPPSMTSNSTLPSPRESLMSATDNSRPSPYWNTIDNNNTGKGMNQQSWISNAEDPFVTFDSFMAFPSVGQIDFSNMPAGPSTSGSSEFIGQFSGAGSLEEQNMAAGYPFPVVNGSNVDLDHGWDWFGVGAPTM